MAVTTTNNPIGCRFAMFAAGLASSGIRGIDALLNALFTWAVTLVCYIQPWHYYLSLEHSRFSRMALLFDAPKTTTATPKTMLSHRPLGRQISKCWIHGGELKISMSRSTTELTRPNGIYLSGRATENAHLTHSLALDCWNDDESWTCIKCRDRWAHMCVCVFVDQVFRVYPTWSITGVQGERLERRVHARLYLCIGEISHFNSPQSEQVSDVTK